MSDLFDEMNDVNVQPPVTADETKMVPAIPAEPAAPVATTRRRRADRNRTETAEAPAASVPTDTIKAAPAVPQETQPAAGEEAPRFQPRFAPSAPSQAVPRPATLQGTVRRPEVTGQETGVRRPVNAAGYSPLSPLGADRAENQDPASRLRRPEEAPVPPVPQLDDGGYDGEDEGGSGGGRGLVAVIIVLLALAVAVVGLLLIPEDDPGFLGNIKRTVTEPLRGLLGGDKGRSDVPAEASGFTANLTQDVAPYKVVFNLETTSNVTDVRVVDAQGNAMPTTTLLSYPYTDSTIVWQFEMTLETAYEGVVQAQILDGETWIDTGKQLILNIGGGTPSTISNVPQNTVVLATDAATATAALTADPTVGSTVSPYIAATATSTVQVTEAPVQQTEVPTKALPAETEAPLFTATPTLAMTATPTLMPTATPTAAATAEPTAEPTPTATPEPTATPTPEPTQAPTPTPKLEAQAAEGAEPDLISTQKVYVGTKSTDSYRRETPINMPAGDEYLPKAFGVLTYRGNAFRQNAASGYVANPTGLSSAWTVEAGSLAAKSRTFYGFSWGNQPAIVKWPKEIRGMMNLPEERKAQANLKEVILAGQDGKIYFLDLNDGTATREAIDFGYPMRATPALHPLSHPVLFVGQYGRFLKDKSGDIGLYYYDLTNGKQLRMIDGLDGKTDRQYNNVGAFDTSPLIDQNSNTLVTIGTNGLLYTETLSLSLLRDVKKNTVEMNYEDPQQVVLMSHARKQKDEEAGVESSLAMYGSYAYYADLGGLLRCVDTTTMSTVWAVDTGDMVKAAIALDLDSETNTLWLYTANVLDRASKGDVTIRRYNAMTGAQDWAFAAHAQKKNGMKDSYGNTVTAGAMASPVIGQNGLNSLVYFTLSGLTKDGNETVTGNGEEALPGVLIALDKQSGEVVWSKPFDTYAYSSPVAVYDKEGRGWIIQATSTGTLYLLDGLTGAEIATLQVNGTIEASPAVYGDTLVIGTTGKGTSYIYGIKIK